MKTLLRYISATALVAVSVVACQKEQNIDEKIAEGVEINVIADGGFTQDTKTAVVDGAIPSVKWLSTDNLTIYEIVDDEVNQTTTSTSTTLTESDFVANFKATIPGADPKGSSYKYAAVYPADAVSSGSGFYRLTMPDAQTLNGNNFAANSDLLISEVLDHGATRVTADESIAFRFRRIGTAVKLTLKGITADEKIKKVIITAPHYIAGRVKYVRETSSLVPDSWHYGSEHQNTITLTVPDITATGTDVLWFRVLAAEKWANGEELSIEVETDQANYYRNGRDGEHAVISLPKDVTFADGGLTAFGVNLASYRVAKPSATDYTLVEDNAKIAAGAEYLVVYTAGSKAMGAFSTDIYNPTDVTITSKVISITSEAVTVVTLEDAGDGKFFLKVGDGEYLYSPTSNKIYYDAKGEGENFKWTVATDKIQNVGTSRYIQYNTSSPRFACYNSGQKDVNLYVNEETVAPVLPVGISFETASYEFVEGSAEYLAFTGQAVTKAGGASDERAVTYTVDSDESGVVTSINASTGAIVLSGNSGTATIKASVGATTGVYSEGFVTYTITVTSSSVALPFSEKFDSSIGTFTINNVSNPDALAYIWSNDATHQYMKATSYVSSTNHDAESWLISPWLNLPSLTTGESIKLKFDQCINKYFGTVADEATLWVKPFGGDWTKYTITYPSVAGVTYSAFEQQVVDLSTYAGQKVQIAFKYVGTSTTAGTWEVKNITVRKYDPLALTSISVSGQKTSFSVGDSFSFGGTVTAHYNDDSTADVTASAEYSGYDMSSAGEQTVTVSYTESAVTKTTEYGITVSAGGGGGSAIYSLYSGALTEGDYVIYYGGKAMKNTVANNRLQYSEVTPVGDQITDPDESIVWHIASSGDYWTIYNAAAVKYAGSTGSKNQATLLDNASTDNALWTVTGNETYEFENKARAAAGSDPNNKWLRNNGTYGFACYASGTGGELSLYKLN